MNWDSSKNLGGIGALLMFIGLIPFAQPFTGIIALIGFVLLLISLHGFADYYKEQSIFNNALYGFITGIIAVAAVAATVIFAVLPQATNFLQQIYPGWDGSNWAALSGMTPDTSNIDPSAVMPFLSAVLLVLVVVWLFSIIVTFLYRKSLKTMAVKSGTHLFSTAGLILLIGGATTIILIGFLLIWIALLLVAIAFFTMKPAEPVLTQSAPASPSASEYPPS